MSNKKIVITDYGFKNIDIEKNMLMNAGYEVVAAQCKTADEVREIAHDAAGLLVQWAPVPASVIQSLENCKIIVRYGIGVDNIDLGSASEMGIPVCNVPQYCINEVADHSMALALSLARQLEATRRQMDSIWKITPPFSLQAFDKTIFGTAGFGRIAREVINRARAFRFKLIAYDPYVDAATMKQMGVEKVSREELMAGADILSLHLPLNQDTHHFLNAGTIASMKKNAIIINTSRGGLIDTLALADALQQYRIGGAGLDVFETEPLPGDHPLWSAPNTQLTSHTAWFSEDSVPTLQKMATEELIRGLKGEQLINRVN